MNHGEPAAEVLSLGQVFLPFREDADRSSFRRDERNADRAATT